MWIVIIVLSGLLALPLFMLFGAKLYKFKGTKLKTRVKYAAVLFMSYTLIILWLSYDQLQIIGKGLLLGAALSIPFYFYSKRWITKKIEGTTIFYKRKQFLRNLLWVVPVIILINLKEKINFMKQIFDVDWPILGILFACFITAVFTLSYIIKLERKLGSPILEDEK